MDIMYCGYCGEPLPPHEGVCPECGEVDPEERVFCEYCGEMLEFPGQNPCPYCEKHA